MRSAAAIDPVELARALIRRPSVTPKDAGAMAVVEAHLTELGFKCRRLKFGEIENLYARRGEEGPNLCFAGHTDVVPEGDPSLWTNAPFSADIAEAAIWGRGAVDMKSAIAAFIAACDVCLRQDQVKGSLSFLITGDEEGEAIDGTRAVVDILRQEGERIDHCLVGEPTSAKTLGDMIKIGRRGSVNIWIEAFGVQGHVAYPHQAANPITALVALLDRLKSHRLDDGFEGFQASNLEVTDLEVGNPAQNVIPGRARARLNIRFNPSHRGADLVAWVEGLAREVAAQSGVALDVKGRVSGEAFLTPPGAFVDLCVQAIAAETGQHPDLSTTGGTSDARFIRTLCPVIEFGLVGATMHKVDEHVPIADVERLSAIYARLIALYFDKGPL